MKNNPPKKQKKIFLILFLFPTLIWSQKTSIVKGFIKDSDNNSIENVSVRYGETGTTTNSSGFYQIRIPVNIKITLKFSHVGYKTLTKEFFSKKRNIIRFSPVLISENEVLEEVVLKNETLVGIITDGDLRRALLDKKAMDTNVLQIMSKKPLTVSENTSKEAILKLMKDHDILHVPILNSQGILVGLETLIEVIENPSFKFFIFKVFSAKLSGLSSPIMGNLMPPL